VLKLKEKYKGENFKMTQKLKTGLKTINILFEGHQKGKQEITPNELNQEAWNKLQEAKRENLIVEGLLIALESHRVDEGTNDKAVFGVVEFEGLRGYIPLDDFPAVNRDHLGSYVGTPVSFKVLSADQQEDSFFVGSRKQALEHMQDYFDKVAEKDAVVKAIVNKVDNNQIRVNVGGYELKLPISDLGFGWISDINDLVSTGDVIDVMVLDKGKKRETPTVSRKAVLKNPFPECLDRYQKGSDYLGTVTGFVDSGVFVNLEQGVDTLADTEYVEDIGIGDKIIVRINNVKKLKNVKKDTPLDQQYQIKSGVVRKV